MSNKSKNLLLMIGTVISAFLAGFVWYDPDLSTWTRAAIGTGCLIAVWGLGYCISYSQDCAERYKREEQEHIDKREEKP